MITSSKDRGDSRAMTQNWEQLSKSELIKRLAHSNISYQDWGQGDMTKTLDDLMGKLENGDTRWIRYVDGDLRRKIHSVGVDIYYCDLNTGEELRLVESERVIRYEDGRESQDCRRYPEAVSGKLRPSEDAETPIVGAQREIREKN